MSFYVYSDRQSNGANELAEALNGTRLRRFQGGRFYRQRNTGGPVPTRQGDVIICWGSAVPDVPGLHILNNADIVGKYTAAVRMREAGVPTVEVSRTRPTNIPTAAATFGVTGGTLSRVAVRNLMTDMQRFLDTPDRPTVEWLGRSNGHIGGNDLLRPGSTDFFSKKEDLDEEYRIHVFDGRSIRAGIKRPRTGFRNPHQWIRSYDGGWSIVYDGFESNRRMREAAAAAVSALGLEFGAVDLGKKRGTRNDYIVLEVNRSPGLEGNTVTSYANAIRRWNEE